MKEYIYIIIAATLIALLLIAVIYIPAADTSINRFCKKIGYDRRATIEKQLTCIKETNNTIQTQPIYCEYEDPSPLAIFNWAKKCWKMEARQ